MCLCKLRRIVDGEERCIECGRLKKRHAKLNILPFPTKQKCDPTELLPSRPRVECRVHLPSPTRMEM